MSAYIEGLRRSFDFAGRSTRRAFWLFTLVYFIVLVVLTFLDGAFGTLTEDGIGLLGGIAILLHFVPTLSVTIRRLHDTGRSGWWILIAFVPLIGLIWLIVLACMPSQPVSNRFGDNPAASSAPLAVAPTPAPQSPSSTLTLDQVEKLAALRESGAIDDDEFKAMKADLLAKGARS